MVEIMMLNKPCCVKLTTYCQKRNVILWSVLLLSTEGNYEQSWKSLLCLLWNVWEDNIFAQCPIFRPVYIYTKDTIPSQVLLTGQSAFSFSTIIKDTYALDYDLQPMLMQLCRFHHTIHRIENLGLFKKSHIGLISEQTTTIKSALAFGFG